MPSFCGGVQRKSASSSNLPDYTYRAPSSIWTVFGPVGPSSTTIEYLLILLLLASDYCPQIQSGCIVCLDWRWKLGVAHFYQSSSCWNGLS